MRSLQKGIGGAVPRQSGVALVSRMVIFDTLATDVNVVCSKVIRGGRKINVLRISIKKINIAAPLLEGNETYWLFACLELRVIGRATL